MLIDIDMLNILVLLLDMCLDMAYWDNDIYLSEFYTTVMLLFSKIYNLAVLSGTKYGLKQTRGKFGLGAKMVCWHEACITVSVTENACLCILK